MIWLAEWAFPVLLSERDEQWLASQSPDMVEKFWAIEVADRMTSAEWTVREARQWPKASDGERGMTMTVEFSPADRSSLWCPPNYYGCVRVIVTTTVQPTECGVCGKPDPMKPQNHPLCPIWWTRSA